MLRLVTVLSLTLFTVIGAMPNVSAQPKAKHGRGFVLPSKELSRQAHRVSNAKYAGILKSLPVASQASYDAYTATGGSCIPPIGDQGSCGNCYMWSGMKVCSAAQMTAGVVKPGSGFMLSVQWGLDWHPELGGCDGGDEYQVAQVVQSGGAPSLAQYPGAGQSPGRAQPTTNMTLYSVSSVVYVDPTQTDQGQASTQSIKNAILAYGYVSVAVAAGNDWDNYGPGQTLTGPNSGINHAVGATGWDDNHDNGDGTKGAFVGDNQWGTSWGNNGRFWIKYGAEGYGTEAFITLVSGPAPTPTPPEPTPPAPVPPTPPAPVPPTPVPCTPYFHLLGRPHWRCSTPPAPSLRQYTPSPLATAFPFGPINGSFSGTGSYDPSTGVLTATATLTQSAVLSVGSQSCENGQCQNGQYPTYPSRVGWLRRK